MYRYFKIFVLVAVILFLQCSNMSSLDGREYVNWIEKPRNAINKQKEIEDLQYNLQYCPLEYMLLKEFRSDHISQKLVEDRRKDSLMFFKLRISTKNNKEDILNYNISDNSDYYARVDYLSYGFEENIILVNSSDTLYPALYHYERTYGIAPYADFMFAFKKNNFKKSNFTICIDDAVFNNGIIKFEYSEDQLNNIPHLKTN